MISCLKWIVYLERFINYEVVILSFLGEVGLSVDDDTLEILTIIVNNNNTIITILLLIVIVILILILIKNQ